ncbi:phosphoglycerate kinase [Liberibacter crescens]|nr:phosphoglycerate kinase [Liberibacter crescens]
MINHFRTLDDLQDIKGYRVLLRVDWNVPFKNGEVIDSTRIRRSVSTILELANKGAKVIILSHLGRPENHGEREASLRNIVPVAKEILGRDVFFVEDCIGPQVAEAITVLQNGGILLTENIRFYKGEKDNDPSFIKALASNGDIYVNDAFSVSHRAHASVEGLALILPAYTGRSLQLELNMIKKYLDTAHRPIIAIIGGSKVSTKINLLMNLVKRFDKLVIGGAMANTFLMAQGVRIGRSLCEADFSDVVHRIMAEAENACCELILPQDAVIAREFKKGIKSDNVPIEAIPDDCMILDIGVTTTENIKNAISSSKTLIWNGPLGAFEVEPFDRATIDIACDVARLTKEGRVISVAGGGDTLSALNYAGVVDSFTYISTAGGAFFEFLEGKKLPGIAALSCS